jgi:enoyl-CoA hydratase/carnithine racemase
MTTEHGLARALSDGVLTLTLDRARASNAVNPALATAVADAIQAARADGAIDAVILTGAGDKVFSAGIDVKNPDNLDHAALSKQRREAVTRCLEAIADFDKPLVTALNGHAIGLGCMLAVLGDQVIAAGHATLSLPEVDIGIPTFLGMVILTRLAGSATARDLALTGRRMGAAEAQQRGLVAAIAGPDTLMEEAKAAAGRLAAKHKAAYALDKQWLARGLRAAFDEANARSIEVQPQLAAYQTRH